MFIIFRPRKDISELFFLDRIKKSLRKRMTQ